MGGLGNQMFQYACGRALSKRMSAPLYFDVSAFKYYRLHNYGLDNFSVQVVNAPWYFSLGSRFWLIIRRIGFTPSRFLKMLKTHFIDEEGDLSYQPQRLIFEGSAYLDGYWQCARYFDDFADLIRLDFQLSKELAEIFLDCKKKLAIDTGVTVSVHIRRGDYVTDSLANKTHGLVGLEFYQNAIDFFIKYIGDDFKLIVFSDDPIWVRRNLKSPIEMIHVDPNIDYPQIDMRLMSACDHHIIANSSFSWWGAWLNPSPSKKVIAPARWFKTEALNGDDICPPEWIRL